MRTQHLKGSEVTTKEFPEIDLFGLFVLDELEARDMDYEKFEKAMGEYAPVSQAFLLAGSWEVNDAVVGRVANLFEIPIHMVRAAAGKPKRGQNGVIQVRVAKSLHRQLVAKAQEEGISLNQLVVTYIADSFGRSERAAGR